MTLGCFGDSAAAATLVSATSEDLETGSESRFQSGILRENLNIAGSGMSSVMRRCCVEM